MGIFLFYRLYALSYRWLRNYLFVKKLFVNIVFLRSYLDEMNLRVEQDNNKVNDQPLIIEQVCRNLKFTPHSYMKKIAIYSSLLLLIFASCRKEEYETRKTNPPTQGGELMVKQYFLIDHDTVQDKNDVDAIAHFTAPNAIDYVSVDSVSMNGTPLLINTAGIAGYYGAPVKPATEWAWHVKGGNRIPDFDYTYTTPLPSFTDFASLPDTVDRNKDFVISFKSLIHATTATIKINGGSNPVFKTFSYLPSSSTIVIPASELTGLTPGDALVEIGFQNESVNWVNNWIFSFQNSILIGKHMKIN
jgi:hypothetical protein